jgi:hypothetical protein
VTAREAAEQALAAHLAQLAALEDQAVTAERAAENPPATVPPSIWTCLLSNPLSVLMEPDLDEDGRVLVSAQIATLARIAGVAEELRAEGRAALEAELADKTRLPHQLQHLGNGQLGVIPNPLHPAVPTQASPPGPGAGQGFAAPIVPPPRLMSTTLTLADAEKALADALQHLGAADEAVKRDLYKQAAARLATAARVPDWLGAPPPGPYGMSLSLPGAGVRGLL